MEKGTSVIKSILLIVLAFVLLILSFGGYHLYMGLKSGDLSAYTQKTAVKALIDEEKLSPTQQQLLEEGDMEGLVQDLEENVTQEQIDCAVEKLGEERAKELLESQNPTPAEALAISQCL